MPMLMECEAREKSDSSELRSIDARLDDFLALVAASNQSALLLDFDGTLVRIQRQPMQVRVSRRTKHILDRLSRNQ